MIYRFLLFSFFNEFYLYLDFMFNSIMVYEIKLYIFFFKNFKDFFEYITLKIHIHSHLCGAAPCPCCPPLSPAFIR